MHTTASLDLDRIDSETLRKPFRPAKITFISKSVIYAGYGHGQGSKAVFLTDDRHLNRRPAISPDGQWLAWQTNENGKDDEVFLARIDGAGPRNLTNTPGLDGHPWFSRDGKWIVFESARTGVQEIWKINLGTLKQVQLTFGGKKYSSRTPRW